MSSVSRRRRRQPVRRAGRNRNPSVEVIESEEPERPAAGETSACIDLTYEDDDIVMTGITARPVVDLTAITDSPVVILGSPDSPPRRRRRNHVPMTLTESDSDDEDLQELPPFDIPETPNVGAPGQGNVDPTSPEYTLSCPVCLDNKTDIRRSGRQVFSTTCGHIFCNQCITDAIKVQKKCPSCRKKLTLKQIHPIFI